MSRRNRASLVLAALLAVCCVPLLSGSDKPPPAPGAKVAAFRLPDPRDQTTVSLADFQDRKAVVVVFLGLDCPLGKTYLPRLVELHKEFSPQAVAFLGINSNVQDPPDRVADHACKNGMLFPVLKDAGNKVADQFRAERITEAFVLDSQGTIRYRGRIDDQFGIGYQRSKPTRRDLAEAIADVLAGQSVREPVTAVEGCKINRVLPQASAGSVTYGQEVSRILQKHCQECHRPGQIGPFSLTKYEDARDWSDTIREVVEGGRMPPWHAESSLKFINDRSLPKDAKETLLAWIKAGCPEGDPKQLPKPLPELVPGSEGWKIGKPDLVLRMPEPFEVPAVGPKEGIKYQYFEVKTGFTEDMWVAAAEAKPGEPAVVHHILVFLSTKEKPFHPEQPGNVVLCGVAPGDIALQLPPGVGKKIPAGTTLVFQMHYTPSGKAAKDQSSLGLVFHKSKPEREAHTMAVYNAGFRIPAGAGNHKVEVPTRRPPLQAAQSVAVLGSPDLAGGMTQLFALQRSQYAAAAEATITFPEDGHILGFMPHMHLRGKSFQYEAIHPDGKTEVLLTVPRFDFGWQTSYRLAEPFYRMPKGSKVRCIAHFDNSKNNRNNPDATHDVYWGDQTWEEMMIGWMEYVIDRSPE